MNNRTSRRIKDSFVAAFAGWLVPFSACAALLLIGTIYGAIAAGVSVIAEAGVLFLLIPVFLVSAIVTLAGWALIGIPLALVISDQQIRKLWFMVLIHVAATVIATAILALLLELFESLGMGPSLFADLSDFFFIAGWAAIIGAVGGWKFWALQRFP